VITKETLKKLTEVLLLNSYTLNYTGFVYGKAGVSLTLFELSKYLN
jgi:hypothetical protein